MARRNSLKGISLTAETIVILILAGVVLFSLLTFFGSTFNPVKNETETTFEIAIACGKYVNYDSDCDGNPTPKSTDDPFYKVKNDLETICNNQEIKNCCANYCLG